MKKRLPYENGTWCGVPLRNGGFGTGLVARHSRNGGVLMYLFGPKRSKPATLADVLALTKGDAITVTRAGDLGLIEGRWPIIGKTDSWRRQDWPMPQFVRRDDLGEKAWLVTYADDNPMRMISEDPVPFEITGFERDGLDGAGAVEIVLTQLLS